LESNISLFKKGTFEISTTATCKNSKYRNYLKINWITFLFNPIPAGVLEIQDTLGPPLAYPEFQKI